MESFRVPDMLDEHSWSTYKPLFKLQNTASIASLPQDWYKRKNRDGKTLLVLAVEACLLDALEVLLLHAPMDEIEPGENDPFNLVKVAVVNYNVDNGHEVLQLLLNYPRFVLRHAFARIKIERSQSTIHLAVLGKVDILFEALETHDKEALKLKLEEANSIDGETPLDLAIEQSDHKMVKRLLRLYSMPKRISGENILHRAVQAKNPRLAIVEMILETYPGLLTQGSPLQVLREKQAKRMIIRQSQRDDPPPSAVPSTLSSNTAEVQKIIEYLTSSLFECNMSYEQLRKELGHPFNGPELYLDLTFLEDPRENFQGYLDELEYYKHLKFNTTLRSVRLPNLQCSEYEDANQSTMNNSSQPRPLFKCEGKYGMRKSCEALKIFNFLRERGVQRVKAVKVQDCVIHPHSSSTIKACLEKFDVYSLDWRKHDMSLIHVKDFAPNIQRLNLYSSGNEDILHYWAEIGVPRLKKLRKLNIRISRDELESMDEAGITAFEQRWQQAFQREGLDSTVVVNSVPTQNDPIANEQNTSIQPRQDDIFSKMGDIMKYLLSTLPSSDRPIPAIANMRKNPIKVAIIDTGVSLSHLSEQMLAAQHIPIGCSFVENDPEDPEDINDTHWHSPECSHGSKLAQLITRCNPHCQLYVAKVQSGPDKNSVRIPAAIKALEWAAAEKVDIVCMSWTITQDALDAQGPRLWKALKDAVSTVQKTALVFCSMSDEGRLADADNIYPANYDGTFQIASYSAEGEPQGHHDPPVWYFPSEGMKVDELAKYFRESDTTYRGSSYATALAAGLASFVLYSIQLAYHPRKELPDSAAQPEEILLKIEAYKGQGMKKLFENLCERGDPRFVKPWLFGTGTTAAWSSVTQSDRHKLDELKFILNNRR